VKVVLDVRSPGEYGKGHIPGAVNVPLFSDEERAKVGRGLHSSTFQLNPSRFGHLPVSPSLIDWGKIMHPTYPTTCAHVDPNTGRV
jgi:tRNA 2-selenouridine synthase